MLVCGTPCMDKLHKMVQGVGRGCSPEKIRATASKIQVCFMPALGRGCEQACSKKVACPGRQCPAGPCAAGSSAARMAMAAPGVCSQYESLELRLRQALVQLTAYWS